MVLFERVKEAVGSNLNRAIACEGINFERSRYQFPLHFAAKVVLDGIHDLLATDQETILVVVELGVVGPKRGFGLHIAAINGVEHLLVQLLDRLKKGVRSRWIARPGRRLSRCLRKGEVE